MTIEIQPRQPEMSKKFLLFFTTVYNLYLESLFPTHFHIKTMDSICINIHWKVTSSLNFSEASTQQEARKFLEMTHRLWYSMFTSKKPIQKLQLRPKISSILRVVHAPVLWQYVCVEETKMKRRNLKRVLKKKRMWIWKPQKVQKVMELWIKKKDCRNRQSLLSHSFQSIFLFLRFIFGIFLFNKYIFYWHCL